MAIKTIVFDLGNVILPLDYQKTFQSFKDLGVTHEFNATNFQDPIFLQYEVGAISTEDFRKEFKHQHNLTISDEIFDQAWNAMLLDLPQSHLQFLQRLKSETNYRLLLFSNINDLHYQGFMNKCRQQHGEHFFAGCFDREYYSHFLGHRKPDAEGFLAILKENKLQPEQTVFIDDLPINIQSAKKLGLKTIHFTKELSLFDLPAQIADLDK